MATFMTCAYLWFRADSFGGQGTSQVHPSVAIDGQSLRSAASFGLGLYFAFSGLVNLTGYIVQVLFVPSTLPAFRRAVAWNAVSDIVELVVGVALVLIGGHPKLFGNIAKIARADFMIDEK
ncbi:MAG TPA: hypothetical protein VG944_01715 [Fimbriimonas sp.]|nr:hypothetical protein [Fimbriimonas sp.]